MKSAREMFKELGYEWAIAENKDGKYKITYEHKDVFEKDIEFYLKEKCIYTSNYVISKKEIEAIYQQCKELGWYDE